MQLKKMLKKNVELTYEIRNYLLSGRLDKLGEAFHKGWQLKKTFSNMISNPEIDSIYEGAIDNGACGGKLLGAGGGGYFMFYVSPFNKIKLLTYLKSVGLNVQTFRFEENGLQTWSSRIEKSQILW